MFTGREADENTLAARRLPEQNLTGRMLKAVESLRWCIIVDVEFTPFLSALLPILVQLVEGR